MSLEIWPPISPGELKIKEKESLDNELAWILAESLEICKELKHGLEDCYALLAPIDPGSTLVMSTPRNEKVKGTITRVGTRIVKGSLNLQPRTGHPQSLSISPSHPIYLPALDAVNTHLNQAVDLISVTLSQHQPPDAPSLASTLSILADSISQSLALLKGLPLEESDPTWQTGSCPPLHFVPALDPNTSFHVAIQESCLVLWLRVLEPADAPLNFGLKLGLAIGTVRRLEHDEVDLVFRFNSSGDGSTEGNKKAAPPRLSGTKNAASPAAAASSSSSPSQNEGEHEVHVREKIRVVSADPSLISLYSKLGYLGHMLSQTRRNLATVMSCDAGS